MSEATSIAVVAALHEIKVGGYVNCAGHPVVDADDAEHLTPEMARRAFNIGRAAIGAHPLDFDEFVVHVSRRQQNHWWLRWHGIEVPA